MAWTPVLDSRVSDVSDALDVLNASGALHGDLDDLDGPGVRKAS